MTTVSPATSNDTDDLIRRLWVMNQPFSSMAAIEGAARDDLANYEEQELTNQCAICLSEADDAATSDCERHTFCYSCLARHLLGARTCPVCRTRMTFIKTATAHRVVSAFGERVAANERPPSPVEIPMENAAD